MRGVEYLIGNGCLEEKGNLSVSTALLKCVAIRWVMH
jgi:hypothetical protein